MVERNDNKAQGGGTAEGRDAIATERSGTVHRSPSGDLPTRTILWRLLREYAFEHRGRFAVAVGCMLFVAAATASIAWLTRSLVNSIFVAENQAAVFSVGFAIMAAFVVRGVASYFQTVLMGQIGAAIVAGVQRAQFARIMAMRTEFFAQQSPSAVVSRVVQGARAVRSAIEFAANNLVRDTATVVALTIVMVVQDPFMSAFALLVAPWLVYVIYRISRTIKEAGKDEGDLVAGVQVVGVEALDGLDVVKSFGLEAEMNDRVRRAVERMERRQVMLIRLQAIPSPLFDVIGGLVVGGFVFYMGWATLDGDKTPGEIVAFIAAFLLAYEPAKRLGNMNVKLQRQMLLIRPFIALMDNERDLEPNAMEDGEPQRFDGGRLRFEDVTFAYREGGPPALRSLTFEASKGETVAIVGRSGAGKSTVVNLLLGAYTPKSGAILIDDTSTLDMSLATLRSNVSYVGQRTFLFSGTIADNVRFGAPGASDEAVRDALQEAGALDFVNALPQGMDTSITDNAKSLSGGQRQRLAIARAVIKQAPILVLDEATSALDGESERVVRDAVARLARGRTVLVVAHRLSTIRLATRVLVLDEGCLVAEGTHEELYETSSLYRTLFHEEGWDSENADEERVGDGNASEGGSGEGEGGGDEHSRQQDNRTEKHVGTSSSLRPTGS